MFLKCFLTYESYKVDLYTIFENISIEIIAVFVVSLFRISVVRMLAVLVLTFSSFKLLLP